jgi:hypothetical protein
MWATVVQIADLRLHIILKNLQYSIRGAARETYFDFSMPEYAIES